MRRGRGGGFGGGGGVERKWKRVAEKGDNEGRETQIGQNNILVGHFALHRTNILCFAVANRSKLIINYFLVKKRGKKTTAGNQNKPCRNI